MAEPSYQELLEENRRLRAENERLQKRVSALEQQLRQLAEALEASGRAGKRQAAPFSRGEPKPDPKPPGRKPGAEYGTKAHRSPPAPDQIDEFHEAALPAACSCGGVIEETTVAPQYQTEIPRKPIHRMFHVHLGYCTQCGRTHQGRHPLQTSDALGAAGAQLGPDAQAAAVLLNKQSGLSYGKIVKVFADVFGIIVSRGGVAQAVLRGAERCEPHYEVICESVRQSPVVVPDETGWRVGGVSHWLHTLVGTEATVYQIDRSRGAEVAANILGEDYQGGLGHDGFASYDSFENALHQQCVAHALRRAHLLCEQGRGSATEFPRAVIELFQSALRRRDLFRAGRISADTLADEALTYVLALEKLTSQELSDAAQARFARHLSKHLYDWFTFMVEPQLEATNFQAEQALRGAVVNRKVWGGNRTDNGAAAQSVLTSVLETCRRQGHSVIDFLSSTLCGFLPPILSPK